MDKIRCLIIDDEEPARMQLAQLLKNHPDFELVGECQNAFEGIKAIQDLQPNLIFLDIQMPRINGFEMLELINDPPHIIFSTAYNEFAIKAFDVNAVDYLLKPFTRKRFDEAVLRAKDRIRSGQSVQLNALRENIEEQQEILERIIVKKNGSMHIIPVQEIISIESKGDYVQICTEKECFMKQKALKYYEKQLPDSFCRVHRSFIINLKKLRKIEAWGKETWMALLVADRKALVSKSGMARLKEQV